MKKNTLSKKILSKIVLMGSITFIIVIILSYFMLILPLNNRIITETQGENIRFVQQTDYLLSYIRDYTNIIAIDKNFKNHYINYVNDPTSGNHSQIDLALSEMVSQWTNINGVMIEIEDGETFGSIGKLTEIDMEIMSGGWYNNIRNTDYASGFSKMYETNSYSGIYAAAYSKNYYLYGKRFTATIFFNASEIVYAMQNLSAKNTDAYMWVGENNEPFYLSGDEKWSEYIIRETDNMNRWGNSQFDGYGGVNFVNYSQNSGWRFISYISNATLLKAGTGYILNVVVILGLFYLLAVTFIAPVVNNTIRPINKLAQTMQEVSKGNLSIRSQINTRDEIEDVSNVFNNMINDINDYISRLIYKEKIEQKIRYSLLASQIDLHFIFNTMNRINYLANKGEYNEIILVNTALIKIMKDSLRFDYADIMDTVDKEIDVVKQYLTIIGSHYNDVIEVEWIIDDQLLSKRIPKNIIQPLVENAVFHGLTNDQGEIKGKVTISVQKDNETNIVIRVSDNGNGMSEELLESFREKFSTRANDRGLHVGLNNIRRRLIFLFGNEDCLKIESKIDEGTTVTLTFKPE